MARAPRPTKTVLIRYREFTDVTEATGGLTLESALRDALNIREENVRLGSRWAKRIRRDPQDPQEHSVANHVRDGTTYIFGNLVAYTMGRDQALLVENENANEADIEQFRAPARKQFINSMMFWMVTDNHVFVLRHGQLTPPDLEEYFRWLLVDRTSICGANLQVILNEKISLQAAGIRHEDVRAVRIGGQVHAHAPAPVQSGRSRTRETRRAQRAGGIELARQVLDLVVGNNEGAVDRILREVPEGIDLSVDVEIGFETSKRKFSHEAMRRVAMATRNLPDTDVEILTKSGTVTGDQIRLSHAATVPLVGSLLERDAVLAAMIAAYVRFVRGGKIDPSELPVPDEQ